MDLVRWSHRVRHRVAEHSMAAAKSLAHVRAIEQHCAQRQKRRSKPGAIHCAADCFHESGNASAVARWVVLGVRFRRRPALYGAWSHISGHAAEFIILHGKSYYLASAYLMLLAAGGVALERVFGKRLRWFKLALLVVIVLTGALFAPLAIPILPPGKLVAYMRAIHQEPPRTETSHTAPLPQLFADQFGWQEMVASVAHVYHHLRPEDEKRAAIFCQNYGEAGAIDFFGPKFGLPPAISGHQNYFLWGPRDWNGEVALVLDTRDDNEREQFASVEDLGQIVSSPWAMPFERRTHIYLCRDLKVNVRQCWAHVKKWL